jgi:hypothetical protein
VPNGDFFAGNDQFSSDYAYADLNTLEGEYTVGTNPQAFNANLLMIGDHTTGGIDPVGPSELSFYANDELLGTRTSTQLGAWEGLSTT